MRNLRISRRSLMQAIGAVAWSSSVTPGSASSGPRTDGSGNPKICMSIGAGDLDEGSMRLWKQIGVDDVLMGGPRIPWQEADIRSRMDRLKSGGLTLGNMVIAGFPNTRYGRPGRDEEIEKVCQSIRAAGRAGRHVVEYNFYARRAMEGYYEETGRAGAGHTAFDYDRMRDLPPLPEEGAHSLE